MIGQKACFMSQFLRTQRCEMASDVSNCSSSWDITGAAVDSLDQVRQSWLPRTMMRYFARFGRLNVSYFMVAMAIEGKAFTPLLRDLNCCLVSTSHVGNKDRPSNSSSYAASQIVLSESFMFWWANREVGAIREWRPCADTWRKILSLNWTWVLVWYVRGNFVWPLNSWPVSRSWWAEADKSSNKMPFDISLKLPGQKIHCWEVFWHNFQWWGLDIDDKNRVALQPSVIQ